MTVNVPLLPRQGSGSSLDPYSRLVSPSLTVHTPTSPPSSTQSSSTPTSTPPTDSQTQSSSPTSSSTTISSFPASTSASTSASSTDDRSSASTISSSVTVSSSMATSASISSPGSDLSTSSPSNLLPTSSTDTPASSAIVTSVTGTGVPQSLTSAILSSLTNTASPSPTTNEPPLSSTTPTSTPNSIPNSTPNPPTLSTSPVTSSPSTDPVGGNLSATSTSTIIATSTSTITGVGGFSSPSTQPGFMSGVTGLVTSSSSNPLSLTQPVTFTTTNSVGSTFTTVPDSFTTVFVTTRANGQSTTISQIVINPTGILSPGDNRSQNEFFRNKGAVAAVFLAVGLTAIAIVILGIFAIRKRRKARRQREVDLAIGARGASRTRSPLEPDEAGQDPRIYAVAARHSPVEMRSGAPGPGEESSGSFGYGPSAFGSAILLNPPGQATNGSIPPEQQPHRYYPYPSSGRRSPSPGEELPLFARGPSDSANAPPAYFSTPHSYSRMRTPSPILGGPLVSVPDSQTNRIRGAPPSAYSAVIFSDSKQPSSEGHGSIMENRPGPGLEGTDTPSGTVALPPVVAYAYEPEPVTWNHRIVGASPVPPSPPNIQISTVEQQEDPQSNRGSISNRSASVYSQEWEAEPDSRPTLRVVNDPRISPELGMRLRGGLASEHSFGPRDDEDWSRRVGVQMIANDSTLQVANPTETRRPAE